MRRILDVYIAAAAAFIAVVLFVPQLPYQPTEGICLVFAGIGWLILLALIIRAARRHA
jgi:hypothetical protein